ncbi:MAG TPA: glycosyltransferase [Bryobacteraceae bacterium]|jgi:GT2 family glycosyltransferase
MQRPGDASRPVASILIPSSGRPQTLELTLNALCRQTTSPSEFEVIVVDDGATPPVAGRLAPYTDRLTLRTIRLERVGPGAARNAAAKIADAGLLIFLDDDCVPGPGWLKAYLAAFDQASDCVLVGPIVNGLPGNEYAEAYHLIFGHLYSRHIARNGVASSAPFVISANFAAPSDQFRSIGGFDETFRLAAEDRMFSENWLHHGRTFRAVPEAIVFHHRPLTFSSYLKQQYRYGRGGVIFRRALAERGWSGRRLEPGSFYRDLLLTAFRHPDPRRRIPLFILLLLSQAAITTGYAAEYARPWINGVRS